MRNSLILLIALILLYLVPSLILQYAYGDSYGFLAGENCWKPDGSGGWVQHGHPQEPKPVGPSVNVPLLLNYVPILLPGLVLAVFLFTPLSRRLQDKPKPPSDGSAEQEAVPPPDS